MRSVFIARIKWIPFEDGGRSVLIPQGVRYCPIIHIPSNKSTIEWSIDFISPNFKETDIIEFKFLSNNAPEELLKCGEIYGLFEGPKKVAIIKILNKKTNL